jgi:N-acetylglutamate synthase-like GNAT family acetyltransferase
MSIHVRPATAEDFPHVAGLLTFAHLGEKTGLEETTDTIRERSREALIIVAEAFGVVAGTMTLAAAGTPYGPIAQAGEMEVSRVAVDPIYRRKGIAANMLASVVQSSRNQGVKALVGITLNSMPVAHRMYEALGATHDLVPGTNARIYKLHLTDNQEN